VLLVLMRWSMSRLQLNQALRSKVWSSQDKPRYAGSKSMHLLDWVQQVND
jgi:hypothetical protein